MAVLSREQIDKLVEAEVLKIEPFYKAEPGTQPASYDLRLGNKILIRGRPVDLAQEKFMIHPGQFVAALTEEVLTLPNDICGRFGVKSSFARKGLIAFGGIQIDPGFNGRVAVSLFNVGPEEIELKPGEPMFTVEFNRLEEPAKYLYAGDYQDQYKFPSDQEEFILKAQTTCLEEFPSVKEEVKQSHLNILEILGERNVVRFFADKVSRMPEVKRVLVSQEQGAIDVFTIFNSTDINVRYRIYDMQQEALLTFEEAEVDFHTTNLADFDQEAWPYLIPSDAKQVFPER